MKKYSFIFSTLLAAILSLSLISCDSGGSSGSGDNTTTNTDTTSTTIQGILDTSFSDDGIITHNNAAGGNDRDYAHSIALDSSGNIYAVGESRGTSYDNMVIWKYKSDGTLDTDFGTNGIVSYDNGTANEGLSMVISDSGDIYVSGMIGSKVSVWKYNSDGNLDMSFAASGVYIHDDGTTGYGNSIKIDSSNRILVTGSANSTDKDMLLIRLTASGSLDTTFNSDGIVTSDNPSGASTSTGETGESLYIYGNKIYVTGTSNDSPNNEYMVIWRYTESGELDTTFSGDGIVTITGSAGGSGYEAGQSIKVDSEGNIYVCGAGENTDGDSAMILWKYNSDGELDSSFGTNGISFFDNTTEMCDTEGLDLIIDNSGIYVTGESENSSGNYCMVVWKYSLSGSLDTSFGTNGAFSYCGAAGGNDDSGEELIIYNNRLYIIGSSNSDMALWKLK